MQSETEKTTQQGAEGNTAETPPSEKPGPCLICGQLGPPLLYGHWIYDHCQHVVLAEAVSKKRKIEKEWGPVLAR